MDSDPEESLNTAGERMLEYYESRKLQPENISAMWAAEMERYKEMPENLKKEFASQGGRPPCPDIKDLLQNVSKAFPEFSEILLPEKKFLKKLNKAFDWQQEKREFTFDKAYLKMNGQLTPLTFAGLNSLYKNLILLEVSHKKAVKKLVKFVRNKLFSN